MSDDNTTNATDAELAQVLMNVDGGTLVSLVNRKKGVERGPKGAKDVYGNDLVHVLLWSGHEYGDLVQHSDERLKEMEQTGTLHQDLMAEAKVKGIDASVEVACAAVSEVRDRFARYLGGNGNGEGDERQHFRPLEVNGEVVRGCFVYCGPQRTDPRAPKPGAVYLRGIKVGEKVLQPAPNGHWKAQSKPKTILKRLLEKKLPSGRFVQYILNPGDEFEMEMGKAASKAADDNGIKLRAEAVHDVIRLAQGL
jgi:hypothetical protein